MERTGIILWMSTMIKCKFLLSNGNYRTEDGGWHQIVHEEPWKMVKVVHIPNNCANLLLDGIQEYYEAKPYLSKIQSTRITVVLMLRNYSREALMDLKIGEKLEFDLDILQVDNKSRVEGTLKGSRNIMNKGNVGKLKVFLF